MKEEDLSRSSCTKTPLTVFGVDSQDRCLCETCQWAFAAARYWRDRMDAIMIEEYDKVFGNEN